MGDEISLSSFLYHGASLTAVKAPLSTIAANPRAAFTKRVNASSGGLHVCIYHS
jgi:hypothetical protein